MLPKLVKQVEAQLKLKPLKNQNYSQGFLLFYFIIDISNTFVSDLFELGKGIGENIKLRDLSLNLEFTRIYDIKELAKGL